MPAPIRDARAFDKGIEFTLDGRAGVFVDSAFLEECRTAFGAAYVNVGFCADSQDLAIAIYLESESDAPVDGVLEYQWRKSPVVTIYGGTNEILRTIIAERHLGLPRTR